MKYIEQRFGGNVDEINILFLGDTHTGHPNYREDIVNSVLDEIETRQNPRIILQGDLTEMALTNSVGSTYEQIMTPQQQIEYWQEKLKPYADIIVGAVSGNHNQRAKKSAGIDPMKLIMQGAGIGDKFYNYSFVSKWAFNKGVLHGHHWHGSTSARTNAGCVRKMKKMKDVVDVDFYTMGHTHKLIHDDIDITSYPDSRNMKLKTKRYHFINTGSAVGYEDGYAEMKGYKKVMLGYPIIKLSGRKGNQKIEIDKQVFLD